MDKLGYKSVKRIEFLMVTFYNYSDEKGRDMWVLCEKKFDRNQFVKWNSNNGGVKDQVGTLEEINKRNAKDFRPTKKTEALSS